MLCRLVGLCLNTRKRHQTRLWKSDKGGGKARKQFPHFIRCHEATRQIRARKRWRLAKYGIWLKPPELMRLGQGKDDKGKGKGKDPAQAIGVIYRELFIALRCHLALWPVTALPNRVI